MLRAFLCKFSGCSEASHDFIDATFPFHPKVACPWQQFVVVIVFCKFQGCVLHHGSLGHWTGFSLICFPLFIFMMALLRVAFVGYNDSRWSNGSLGYLQLTKNATIYRSLYCNNLGQGWQTLDRIPA